MGNDREAILTEMRRLLERGWCQGAPARDAFGRPMTLSLEGAYSYSVLGAAREACRRITGADMMRDDIWRALREGPGPRLAGLQRTRPRVAERLWRDCGRLRASRAVPSALLDYVEGRFARRVAAYRRLIRRQQRARAVEAALFTWWAVGMLLAGWLLGHMGR